MLIIKTLSNVMTSIVMALVDCELNCYLSSFIGFCMYIYPVYSIIKVVISYYCLR